jgi:hypothetical protein
VADGDGGILVQQQHGHGLAYNVAAAHHHRMFASDGQIVAFENLDNAGGSAGRKSLASGLQAAGVDRMKSVHILLGSHGVKQRLGVNVRGKRQLDEDSIDVVARVKRGYEVKHGRSCNLRRWRDQFAVDAQFLAGQHLVANVDLRGGDIADQHRGQAWTNTARGKGADFFSDFLLDGGGNRSAVENCWHFVGSHDPSYRARQRRWHGRETAATQAGSNPVNRVNSRWSARRAGVRFRPSATTLEQLVTQ